MASGGGISENSRRIAKNTFFLYFRMLLMTAIGLVSSRIVLQALGVEDYGIYNAVGGFVTLFTFLSNSISASISRFMAAEVERSDVGRLHRIFSTGILIQLLFAAVIVVLVESVGVWFLDERMNIPPDRLGAARFVLHCSLATLVVELFSLPYNATIIAHERMSAFALISIVDALIKLSVALLLLLPNPDTLKLYAALMLCRALIVRVLYGLYCRRHFPESRGRLVWDKALFHSMAGFSTWSTIGSSANVFNTHGVNIVVNLFFGVAVNAARGVAAQIEGLARSFVVNFLTSINPRITKSWAAGEKEYCFELVRKGIKFTYLGIFVFLVPVVYEAEWLLGVWLAEVPAHAAVFVRLTLVGLLVDLSANAALTLLLADGRIRNYYLITGFVSYMCLPLVWLCFKLGAAAEWAYVCFIGIYFIVNSIRLVVVRAQTGFSLGKFFVCTLLPLLNVSVVSMAVAAVPYVLLGPGLFRVLLVCVCGWAAMALTSYFFLLTPGERDFIDAKLMIHRTRRRLAAKAAGEAAQGPSGLLPAAPGASPRICPDFGLRKGDLAIYTCVTGGYDALRQPDVVCPGVDYICFVGRGEKAAERDGVWEIREASDRLPEGLSPTMTARWHKTHPHVVLPDYKASIWIDGNILVCDDSLYRLAATKLHSGVLCSVVDHPSRDCVYSEAWMCFKMGYLGRLQLLRICLWLRLHGVRRHSGLTETNLLFRLHGEPSLEALDELWWSLLLRLAPRDQLSFDYCLSRSGLPRDLLLGPGLSVRNHPSLRYLPHKA